MNFRKNLITLCLSISLSLVLGSIEAKAGSAAMNEFDPSTITDYTPYREAARNFAIQWAKDFDESLSHVGSASASTGSAGEFSFGEQMKNIRSHAKCAPLNIRFSEYESFEPNEPCTIVLKLSSVKKWVEGVKTAATPGLLGICWNSDPYEADRKGTLFTVMSRSEQTAD